MDRTNRIVSLLRRAARSAVNALFAPPSRQRDNSICGLDLLEQRRLFSFQIHGTELADSFIINVQADNKIHLTFNGGVEVFDPPADGFVSVLGFGGDDTMWLQNTGNLRFTLSGFAGDDAYHVGNGVVERDIKRDVLIAEHPPSPGPPAHGGTDSILIDDSISSGGTTYIARQNELKIASSPSLPVISWAKQPEDSVKLEGSLNADILFVEGLPQNSLFDMGDGDDTVVLGAPDKIVPTDFPDNATIADGGGFDELVIDDSNPNSPRTSIDFDDSGFVNSVNFNSFHKMEIRTHVLAGDLPQPVTFRGRTCPAFSVIVVGTDGPDLVQFGTFQHPIDIAELYVDDVTLKLKTGSNKLEVDESDDATGHAWKLIDNKLEAGIMTINNPLPVVGPAGVVDVLIKGTRNADRFLVARSSLLWNVTFDGRGGDDVFEQAPLLIPGGNGRFDLDDNFVGYVKFDGSSGEDSVILNDSDDEVGDADHYTITSRGIRKGDFQEPSTFALEYSFIDRLTVYGDEDPNTVYYDVSGLDVADIFGLGGTDTFINRNDTTQLPVLVNSLAALTRLHGGAGSNKMFLDDGSGGAGNYDLGTSESVYTRDATTLRAQFSGMAVIDVNGSNHANTAVLRAKPPGAVLSFAVNGGDDTLIVGGGDIYGSGLHNATLTGGAGEDHIRFDDRLDDHHAADADTLTINFQTVNKDGVVIAFGAFESLSVLTSGVNNGPVAFPNTVRVHSIGIPTEIIDTPGDRDTDVEVGNGPFGLNQVLAPLKLTSTDSMELDVHDPLSNSNKLFRVTATKVLQTNPPFPLDITHSGLSSISILAGNVSSDWLVVEAVEPGTHVFFSGGGGDDTVFVGDGTFANIRGPVHFSGGSGTGDRIVFNNGADGATDPISSTLNSFSFKAGDGPLHQFFSGVEQVHVAIASSGGTNLTMNSATADVTVTGSSADDHVTVNNLLGNLTFDAGSGEVGGDSILIDDSATTTNDKYTLNAGDILRKNTTGPAVTLNGVERGTLRAGSGHNTITVESTTIGDLQLFANAGNDGITVNDSTGFVTIHTGSEVQVPPGSAPPLGDFFGVNIDGDSVPAFVRIAEDDTVILFQVGAGGTLRIEDDAVLCKAVAEGAIPLPPFLKGVLDLAGGALLNRDNGLDVPFRQWISAGRNGGAWDGTGPQGAINSSRAAASTRGDGVGYGLGSQLGITTIGSYTIEPGDVLIRYALDGDANLDGQVNLQDFNRLAANFGQAGRQWTHGDVNYDGTVNLQDFNTLATNFGASLGGGGLQGESQGESRERDELAELN